MQVEGLLSKNRDLGLPRPKRDSIPAGATNEINRTSPFAIHALFLPCDQILTAFPDFPPLTMSRYTTYCTST